MARATKSARVVALIQDALTILESLGIPLEGLTRRRKERMAMAFLAVADMRPGVAWTEAKGLREGRTITTRQAISYINQYFKENISSGSYDDIRREDLKLPVVAGFVIKSAGNQNAATNDPTRGYAIAPHVLNVLHAYGTQSWDVALASFMEGRTTLQERLAQERPVARIPITIRGEIHQFSPGEHNLLQKAIIEEFLPRFGHRAEVLYVGDTAHRRLYVDEERIKELGFFELRHGELPDVLAYSPEKNWLFFIEAVHSANPISPVRHLELQQLTANCTAGIVYVTVFQNRLTFKQFVADIAWETEVWISDEPDHLIHFNGSRFLGPYAPPQAPAS